METVPLSAGPLDVHVTGTIGARPVVLVHGALVDHRVWSDVPERLATHGLRCFTPVLPLGWHRRPMRPDADLSPSSLGRLLGELLDVLDLTDVTLVGNDTGGALCQLLVATGPARVGRLVLTNCDGLDLFPRSPSTSCSGWRATRTSRGPLSRRRACPRYAVRSTARSPDARCPSA